jgi:hypothetical protein
MLFVEIGAGVAADSRSLQADALDFLGDAANYAISLGAAGAKGLTILLFGVSASGRGDISRQPPKTSPMTSS